MPEIKLKHVVSFSSEDKVHKAENLLKPETYRKWKCATPGEKNASVVLQFEKAMKIQSIDIGNECSAFVEVLVGRSSDSLNDFQVLLVASSFMSPLESRNETHANRVRMFGSEKLSQNVRDEKWDCVQIVCTQPFNKNISYGLTFIKFHSPSEINEQTSSSEAENATTKFGAFKLKSNIDDEETLLTVGSWFGKKKEKSESSFNTSGNEAPSYAAAVLASSSNSPSLSPQNNIQKRKIDNSSASKEPPAKKATNTLNKDYIIYRNVLGDMTPESKKESNSSDRVESNSKQESKKLSNLSDRFESSNKQENKKVLKTVDRNESINKPDTNSKPDKPKKKVPFTKIMGKVVFVLSGFVNPLRSELRDKALEMGAKYKGDWDSTCTHLICAFINTPKYVQVQADGGRIVKKEWITDCYKKKTLLPWRSYMLGKYTIDTSGESDDTDEEPVNRTQVKNNIRTNGTKNKAVSSPVRKDKEDNISIKHQHQSTPQNTETASKDESETEDEDAFSDYRAETDVDSDSGGDTEDEIRKVESKARKKASKSPDKSTNNKLTNSSDKTFLLFEKPDVSDLPLPELPNIFKQRHFFLYGKFSLSNQHDLQRYITAYNGILEDYMNDKIKYVITEAKWDQKFEDALSENEDLIFVKPLWIYKCHETGKLVPFQPYIITPES